MIKMYLPTQQTNRTSINSKSNNVIDVDTERNEKLSEHSKYNNFEDKQDYVYIAVPFPPLSTNPADHIPENPVDKVLEAIDPKIGKPEAYLDKSSSSLTSIKLNVVSYLKKESTREKLNGNVASLKKNIGPLMEKISQNSTMKSFMDKLMATINSKEDFILNMNSFFLKATDENSIENITKDIEDFRKENFNDIKKTTKIHLQSFPTIEIYYPDETESSKSSERNSDHLSRFHLQNIIDLSKGRMKHHANWKIRNLVAIPFTSLLAVLPGPNIFVYWNMYRFYCHYRCQQGSEEIANRLQKELVRIENSERQKQLSDPFNPESFVVKFMPCKDLNAILQYDGKKGKDFIAKEANGRDNSHQGEKILRSYGMEKRIENLLKIYHRWR